MPLNEGRPAKQQPRFFPGKEVDDEITRAAHLESQHDGAELVQSLQFTCQAAGRHVLVGECERRYLPHLVENAFIALADEVCRTIETRAVTV